jgi:hypothetical protein
MSERMSGKNNPMYGRHHTDKTKKLIGKASKKKHYTLKWRRDMSERMSGKNHPMFGKPGTMLGKHLSSKTKRKMAVAHEGMHHSSRTKKKIGDKAKKRLSDPKNNPMYGVRLCGKDNPMFGKHHSSETIKLIRVAVEKAWKNPEHAKRVFAHRSPNNKELECFGIIDSAVPKDFKFVGNGQVTFGGKCPDFMNVNGKKLLIEFNSEYWHKGENTRTRYRHFAKYGHRTLFIWQRELKNPEKLKKKILEFVESADLTEESKGGTLVHG